jgi:hypothetical protein
MHIVKSVKQIVLIVGLILTLSYCSRVGAQLAGANLSGVVRDPSGAVVPNAAIAIKNTGTNEIRNITSNSDGLYSAPNLPAGNYDITVTAAGFSSVDQKGLVLNVGAQVAQDFALTVGQTTQTVEVTSAAPTIETTSSTIGATVGETKIVELPLNGRDWTQLATLEPGVTSIRTQTNSNQNANRGNRGFGNQLTDDGHRPNENTYRIDGININDYSNGSPGSVLGESLGVDAIQEFNVVTTNYTAEYGRTSGAVINAVTRSGTNQFHGTAFFFDRDRAWDARNYFDPSNIPPFLRKQFGVSGGGPIIKDKFFIFSNYEGVRQGQSQTFSDVIPSAAARAGIICSIPIATGPNACTTQNVGVSPLTGPYFALWPDPTKVTTFPLGGSSDNGDSVKWNTNALKTSAENFWTVRGDYKLSAKDSLAATYFLDFAPETIPDAVADNLVQVLTHRQMGGLTETHIFGSSTVNTARLGYNRVLGLVDQPYQALTAAAKDPSLALPGLGNSIPRYSPEITITGITQTGGLGWNTQDNHRYQSFQANDDLAWVRGNHSLQAGFAFERMLYDMQFGTIDGSASFANNIPVPGSAMKNFLTDYVNGVSGTPTSFTGAPEYVRDSLIGMYFQDTWRFRSNLTLNLGLRYEFLTQPIEANNRWGMITDLITPVTPVAPCGNVYPAPFVQTNVPGCVEPIRQLWNQNPTRHDFDPRVGFSWDPFRDGKTAVRAGFGMFDVLPLPYSYTYPLSETAPFIEGYSLSSAHQTIGQNEFPNFIPFAPAIFPSGHTLDPNAKRGYAMNWNLNIERTLANNTTFTIGYIGSHTVHDFFTADGGDAVLATKINGVWTWPLSGGTIVDNNVSSFRPILFDTAAKFNGLEAKLDLKPTHRISGEINYTWSRCFDDGDSSSLGDPFSNSLATIVYYDKPMRHGACDFDIPQSLTANYLYELPGIKSDSLLKWAVNGWQWGGIVTASKGVPFSLLTGGDPLGMKGATVDFPNLVPGCAPIVSNFKANGNRYLNPSCFVIAPPTANGFVVGDLGRNRLYGPKLVEWDTSIIKNTAVPKISEAFNIQLRFEFFNVLNHSNFTPPADNNTLGSSLGLMDSTTTTSRQIQLGAKIAW